VLNSFTNESIEAIGAYDDSI